MTARFYAYHIFVEERLVAPCEYVPGYLTSVKRVDLLVYIQTHLLYMYTFASPSTLTNSIDWYQDSVGLVVDV